MDGKNLFTYFSSYILECEQALTQIKPNQKNYAMFARRIDESLAHLQMCATFLEKKFACYLNNGNLDNMYYFKSNVVAKYTALCNTCALFKEKCR